MRPLRLPYTYLHFLALQTLRKWQRTIPPSLAAEVWRFKWFMLSAPCSVLTNRKFPQSFHHRKFPVRKLLTAQTKSSSIPPPPLPSKLHRQLRQCGQKGVSVNRGGRCQGVEGWAAGEEIEGNKEVILLPLALDLSENCLLTVTGWSSPPGQQLHPRPKWTWREKTYCEGRLCVETFTLHPRLSPYLYHMGHWDEQARQIHTYTDTREL